MVTPPDPVAFAQGVGSTTWPCERTARTGLTQRSNDAVMGDSGGWVDWLTPYSAVRARHRQGSLWDTQLLLQLGLGLLRPVAELL